MRTKGAPPRSQAIRAPARSSRWQRHLLVAEWLSRATAAANDEHARPVIPRARYNRGYQLLRRRPVGSPVPPVAARRWERVDRRGADPVGARRQRRRGPQLDPETRSLPCGMRGLDLVVEREGWVHDTF